MVKIIIDDKVYIPLRELSFLGSRFREKLRQRYPDYIFCDQNYGELIKENDFNSLKITNKKTGEFLVEMTRVDSLSKRVEEIQSLQSLKASFLTAISKDLDAMNKPAESVKPEEIAEAVKELQKESNLLEEYQDDLEQLELFREDTEHACGSWKRRS